MEGLKACEGGRAEGRCRLEGQKVGKGWKGRREVKAGRAEER
jgi:hypothetical protein